MAADFLRTNDIDGVVVTGGGSSVGLGKVIGLDTSIPLIALPTTHAGSEMTQEWGLTRGNDRSTGCVPRVLPRTVIYDPELSVTLPVMLSAGGASAHLRHPSGGGRTVQHCRSIGAPLRRLAVARLSCATTMSLHHKLCHVIGGTFDLPHASVHATVLPYVLAYNLPAAPLRELGMPADGIQTVVDKATRNKYANPRPVTSDAVRRLVRARFTVRRRESEQWLATLPITGLLVYYVACRRTSSRPGSRRSISEERNPTTTRFPWSIVSTSPDSCSTRMC
jgi:maleylacetate reductase